MFAHNGLDYLLAMFGAWRLGAIAALVNVRYADDLDYYFGDCRPRVVIYTHDQFEAIDRHRATLHSVEHWVCLDGAQPGAADWAEILGCAAPPPPDVADESDIAHLSYTSGTTGRPKGACLSHEPTGRAARCIAERLRLGAGDVSLGPTALSSSYQLVANLLPALSVAATCWVMNGWDDEAGLDVVERLGATILAANPPVLTAVLAESRRRRDAGSAGSGLSGSAGGSAGSGSRRPVGLPGSLRLTLSGGGPVPPDLKRAWRDELGVTLAESYGQSELGGFVGLGSPEPLPDERLLACGRPLPDKEVRIVDDADREVPIGRTGEIVIRGGFMAGYWGRPEQTAEALRGGWLHTGDVGATDAEGYVFVRGRLSERLTVGGEHWYPRDIEEALLAHPTVADAALVGVPAATADTDAGDADAGGSTADTAAGHQPVAFVVLDDRSAATDPAAVPDLAAVSDTSSVVPAEAGTHCPATGPAATTPAADLVAFAAAALERDLNALTVRIIQKMPMTVTGKIAKTDLRDLLR